MNDFTEFAPATGMDLTSLAQQGHGMVKYTAPDNRKLVIFYNRPVHNPGRSREEGRPIHESKIYVKISEPGERDQIDRPAQPADTQRWPHQWQQFQTGQKQIPAGTPIDNLFPDKIEVAASMKAFGIHTIEQLAHLSADGISRVGMGATEWVNKAKTYIERAEKGVAHHQFEKELSDRDTKINVLENTVTALRQQLEAAIGRMNQMGNMPAAVQPVERTQVDTQTIMINNVPERDYTLPATSFTSDIEQPKPRRGRPPKIKETA